MDPLLLAAAQSVVSLVSIDSRGTMMTSGSVRDGVRFQVSGPPTGQDDCFHALKRQRRVDETELFFFFSSSFPSPLGQYSPPG